MISAAYLPRVGVSIDWLALTISKIVSHTYLVVRPAKNEGFSLSGNANQIENFCCKIALKEVFNVSN